MTPLNECKMFENGFSNDYLLITSSGFKNCGTHLTGNDIQIKMDSPIKRNQTVFKRNQTVFRRTVLFPRENDQSELCRKINLLTIDEEDQMEINYTEK